MDIGKRLDDSSFTPQRGRPSRYPWKEWEDLNPWEIVRGKQYDISTENMQVNLHMRAAKDDLRVQTRKVTTEAGEEGLQFRFFSPADERG